MPWPSCSGPSKRQSVPKPTTTTTTTKKRVSFAPDQPTGCPNKQNTKQVRFTSDTKPASRSNSASSDKTRWPCAPKPTSKGASGAPGLSSVRRDFQSKKTAPKPSKKVAGPDAKVTIPHKREQYVGTPKAKHDRSGYEWVSYEIKVKPTRKEWRAEKWAR